MKKTVLTLAAVSVFALAPANAEFLILSSSFDQEEQETKLKGFTETLSAYGDVKLYRAANGAVTVAMPCKDAKEAESLRGLLNSRELAPADAYIVKNDKLNTMDEKAAKRLFIQVAARRARKDAVALARQISKNGTWNGEIQVWASEENKGGQRWYRVVIPGGSPEKVDALQKFLKTENVIDQKSFVTESPKLGERVFSTADKA